MHNVKGIVEYDGTEFFGFQKQPSTRTVQGVIEDSLSRIFPEQGSKILGAGRTDAGVHATGQVISFSIPDSFPGERLLGAMNGTLPQDVRVKRVEEVPEEFHPRYLAKARTYVYIIVNRAQPSTILRRYTWQLRSPIDGDAMQRAAKELVGVKDFATFGMPHRIGGSTVREIFDIRVRRKKDAVFLVIRGNAFLRGMARTIAGTLAEAGRGNLQPHDLVELLAMRDRQKIRVTAPPQGLFLTKVEY